MILGYPPKTDEQRKIQHYTRYGTLTLPPRGTGRGLGLAESGTESPAGGWVTIQKIGIIMSIVVGISVIYMVFFKNKRS